MKELSTSYNEDANKVIELPVRGTDTKAGRVNGENEISILIMDIAMIEREDPGTKNEPDPGTPGTMREPNEKWREAIRKDFWDIIKRDVWRQIKRRYAPNNRRCVKSK